MLGPDRVPGVDDPPPTEAQARVPPVLPRAEQLAVVVVEDERPDRGTPVSSRAAYRSADPWAESPPKTSGWSYLSQASSRKARQREA